jgi:opacity protein-like surface antigen
VITTFGKARVATVGFSVLALGAALGMAHPVAANSGFNWTGYYGGVMASRSHVSRQGNLTFGPSVARSYTNQGGGDVELTEGQYGWNSENQFTGFAFDAMQSATRTHNAATVNGSGRPTTGFLADPEAPVGNRFDYFAGRDRQSSITLIFGYQHHYAAGYTLGAELQVSAGGYRQSEQSSWTETGGLSFNLSEAVTTSFSNCTSFCVSSSSTFQTLGATTTYTSTDVVGSDGDTLRRAVLFTSASGQYLQNGELSLDLNVGSVFAPVARIGVVHNRLQLFAYGGPAIAQVALSTRARITESASLIMAADSNSPGDQVTSSGPNAHNYLESYSWSGSNSTTRVGFRLGVGVEYAATNNMVLRASYDLTDLGRIGVTGVSDTANVADYAVSRSLRSRSLSIGTVWRF